jgi:ABC-type bacteriocin/lantibiotic exporter with double-glycine peptidase domain
MVPLELQRRIVNGALDQSDMRLLLTLAAVYLCIVLLQTVLKFCLRMYQGWLSESTILYCRRHLSDVHEARAKTGGSDSEEGDGRAVSVIGPEIDKLGGFVGEGLAQPCVNIGTILAIAGYMIVVEPMIALYSLPFIVPQLIAVPWIQGLINRLLAERVSLVRKLSDAVAGLSGRIAQQDDKRPEGFLKSIYDNRLRTFTLKFSMKGFVNLMNALAPLSALVFGGYLVMQGETSVGVIVAFISGFERLADPLRELISDYRLAAQASVQHKMITRWIT